MPFRQKSAQKILFAAKPFPAAVAGHLTAKPELFKSAVIAVTYRPN
jgi:hypothetical protein